jgi:hypothetical protein
VGAEEEDCKSEASLGEASSETLAQKQEFTVLKVNIFLG